MQTAAEAAHSLSIYFAENIIVFLYICLVFFDFFKRTLRSLYSSKNKCKVEAFVISHFILYNTLAMKLLVSLVC